MQITTLSSLTQKKAREVDAFLDAATGSYFQQTMHWKNVLDGFKTDKFYLLVASQDAKIKALLPMYLYQSDYGNILTSIPYPGPLGGIVVSDSTTKKQKEEIYKLLFRKVDRLAKETKSITATIISSPFWPDDKLYKKYFHPTYTLENYTLAIDLTKKIPTTSHFRNNLNRMLKKAVLNNLKIEESSLVKDISEWYKVHKKRHTTLGLQPLPFALFEGSLKEMVPHDKGRFFFVKQKGIIIAGCFVAYHNHILDIYMMSGTTKSYALGAIYLLVNHLLAWTKKRGFWYFNFQSSKPRGSGPYKFKTSWGAREYPYYFFTKAYKPINPLKSLSPKQISKEYPWHYVLPYSLLDVLTN